MILTQYTVPIPPGPGITRRKEKDHVAVSLVTNTKYNQQKGYSTSSCVTIGRVCDSDTGKMHPSDKYKLSYPDEWEKATGEKVQPIEKNLGMYVGVKSICDTTGLRGIMDGVFGESNASSLLDYCMYSILEQTDSTIGFESAMDDRVLFCNKAMSDSYYSQLFEHGISRGNVLDFKTRWARKCKEDGIKEVWLCIDGSNDDCQSEGVSLAEHGHAKSRKNIGIVSFSYAVTTDGKPVTFEVYRGGLVDSKAMKAMIDFLDACGIKLKGVILDRGYCDSNAITYLRGHGIAYLIMIKGSPQGYIDTEEGCSKKIKMNTEYLVDGTCLFAAQKEVRLFHDLEWDDTVTLFFDYQNGSDRITALLKNTYAERARLKAALSKGNKAVPKKSLEDIIKVDPEGGGVAIDRKALQNEIDKKGLYGIVCSEKIPPGEIHSLYSSRNESEVQYRIMKTELGYGTARVHLTTGVLSKFCCSFIASIIRYYIEDASKIISRTPKETIRELDLIVARNLNGNWIHSEIENNRELRIIEHLSKEDDANKYVSNLVDELNKQGKPQNFRHKKPGPKKATHKAKSIKAKGKPGPKPGFKRTDTNKDGSPRQKPGPKVGFKHGEHNRDGSLRQKPGPKMGSHHNTKIN